MGVDNRRELELHSASYALTALAASFIQAINGNWCMFRTRMLVIAVLLWES